MIGKIALIGWLWLFHVCAAQAYPQRFSRDLNMPRQPAQVLLAASLDNAVYANSNADFSDLRLVDQEDVETPYMLLKAGGSKKVVNRRRVRSENTKLQTSGNEGFEIIVYRHKNAKTVDGLTIVTAQRDFEYVLQVQGSDDGNNWQTLVDQALIYDYSRYMSFANHDIALPANHFRHFKIIVAQAVQAQASALSELSRTIHDREELERKETFDIRKEPLHVERIELWHTETETVFDSEWRFDYPLLQFNVSRDEQRQTTLVDVDAQLLPLNGIKLEVSTPNFNRHAEVQVAQRSGIETRMHTIGRGNIEALHFNDFNRDRVELDFPEHRRERYKVVIHDRDNPPLRITGVTGIGPKYQLLFLAQPGRQYRLLYGDKKAEMSYYDTAPLQELLRRGFQTAPAVLGPVTVVSEASGGIDLAELLNSDLFLGLVMGGMVLVLAWSLYRVYKRVAESGRPQN